MGRIWLVLLLTLCVGAAPAEEKDKRELLGILNSQFAKWDTDHDGTLSSSEIDALVSDSKITGKKAAVVAALKREILAAERENRHVPALTRTNLEPLMQTSPKSSDEEDMTDLVGLYEDSLKRISDAKRVLFATGQADMRQFKQGKIGDCFCLAPLGAMTFWRPGDTKAMFKEVSDGLVQVKLGQNLFTVAQPTDAELGIGSTNPAGVFGNLYEKAMGQYWLEHQTVGVDIEFDAGEYHALHLEVPRSTKSISGLDALNKGGTEGLILSLITGHDVTRYALKQLRNADVSERGAKMKKLRKILSAATKERRLMTCNTEDVKVPRLTEQHAYAVLGYDEKADVLKLWNPHGKDFKPDGPEGVKNGYTMKDGVFKMPLGDFVQEFSKVSVEMVAVVAKGN